MGIAHLSLRYHASRGGARAARDDPPAGHRAGQHGRVIHDVDRSLSAWLGRCLPDGAVTSFACPTHDWLTRPPQPLLVNGFLYDIREDVSALTGDVQDIRDAEGTVIGRRPPTRRYRLRYLLTAWPGEGSPFAEHELLGAVLAGCVSHQAIPVDCLVGSLAESGELVTLRCAPSDDDAVGPTLWSHAGVPPRTTLDLVVIAPLTPTARTDLAAPAREFDLRPAAPSAHGRRAPAPAVPERRPRGRVTEGPKAT
jgi:hypothetical protein